MLEHIDALIGIAPADQIGLPKHLEGVQEGEDRDGVEGGRQIGQGDAEETLKRAGAVDGGRLVEGGRDGREP